MLEVRKEAGDQSVDFCEADNLFITNTEQTEQTTEQTTVYMDIARWPIWKSNRLCDWMQEMEKLCSLCQNKTRNRSGY